MGLTSLWCSKFLEPIHKGRHTGYQRTSLLSTTKITLQEECHSCNLHLFTMLLIRFIESACRAIPLRPAWKRKDSILHRKLKRDPAN